MELLKFASTFKPVIAVSPSPKVEVKPPEDLPAVTSNWGIVAAIIIAAMPQLFQWLGGHQKARNTLTETLLQKLTDSYQLASTSNDQFRQMIERIAEKPTELAENNSRALRDLLDEVADLKGKVIESSKKMDQLASIVTREAQKK